MRVSGVPSWLLWLFRMISFFFRLFFCLTGFNVPSSVRAYIIITTHTHTLTLNRSHSWNSKILFTHSTYIASSWLSTFHLFLSITGTFTPSHSHWSSPIVAHFYITKPYICVLRNIKNYENIFSVSVVSPRFSFFLFVFYSKEREWAYRKMDEEK